MKLDNLESEIEYDIEEQILFDAISEELDKEKSEEKPKRKKKIKTSKIKKRLKSGLQIKTVLLLLLTLLINTYAWFIYVSTVSTGIDMHVKNWEFELSSSDQDQEFTLVVEQIYPGMPTATKTIQAKNNGETDAELVCEVNRIQLLDEVYNLGDEYTLEDGTTGTYTTNDLLEKLLNEYPFKVQIFINGNQFTGENSEIIQTGESTQILLQVQWDYESGTVTDGIAEGDELDTYWGMKSYEYMNDTANPEKYSVQIDLTIKAVQYNDEENVTP